MASFMGKSAWWSVPGAVVLGVPMYSNAAGIIPIVQRLLEKAPHWAVLMMAVIGLSLPETIILRTGGLFVFIGADAETDWLPPEIARDPRGYILTGGDVVKTGRWKESRDPYLVETSLPGVFACGDVRFSPVKRVASAVGEGSIAIAFVHQYLARSASG